MMERSEEWWSDEVERLIDSRKVACRKLRGARKRGEADSILKQFRRTVRKIREQGGMSCKLFWTDLSRKRKE